MGSDNINKLKIAFLMVSFPMPATKGGATHTLITHLLEENEKTGRYIFHVYSVYEREAEKLSKNYKNTVFYYVKSEGYLFKIKQIYYYFLNHFLKLNAGNAYANALGKRLKEVGEQYDIVLNEAYPELYYGYQDCQAPHHIIHLHNDYIGIGIPNAEEKLKLYTEVFTNSEYVKKRVLEIDSYKRVYTLTNCIDVEKFKNAERKKETYKKYGLSEGKTIILYVGRISHEKGVLELIQSFISSSYLKQNACLVIAGSVYYGAGGKTDYSSQVANLIEKNGHCVYATGYVPYSKLPDLYAIADIGVVPSFFWEETFGLVAVEHMAAENALIVSGTGALPSVVKDAGIIIGKDGDIVGKLSKALEELVRNEDKRAALIAKGNIVCMSYSKESYCKRFVEIISDVVKR